VNDPEAIVAYRAANSIEARSLAMQLDDAGIEAHVVGESIYEAYPGIRLSPQSPVEVWVSPEDAEAAKSIVDAWRQEHQVPPPSWEGKPRRFQFSARTVLLLMTIVALLACAATFGDVVFSNVIGGALILLEVALALYWLTRNRKPYPVSNPVEEAKPAEPS
jgi:hypothetical protein